MKYRLARSIKTILVLALCFSPLPALADGEKVLFLHHSTGAGVWSEGDVSEWFDTYNANHGTSYQVSERSYPNSPYPWNNYPYDYWNLWVNNGCDSSQSGIECMNTLAANYDVIIFKHCYPGADVLADSGADITSNRKSLENYKLQYSALRNVLDGYSDTLFIIWTLAPRHRLATNEGNRMRAKQFVDWVKGDFLTQGGEHPNIKIFDFFALAAEQSANPAQGEQYALRYAYEQSHTGSDSHPNTTANQAIGPQFGQFIVDSIEAFGSGGPSGPGPGVAKTCPCKNEAAAPTNTVIAAVFDRDMNASSITGSTFTLTDSQNLAESGSVSYDAANRRAAFTPDGSLSSSETYTAHLSTSVLDADGLAMDTEYTWSFTTTDSTDSTGPEVTATEPLDGATEVYRNPTVRAELSERLDSTLGETLLFLKRTDTGETVSGQYYHDAADGVLRFIPTNLLDTYANYTAVVSDAATDLAGNTMSANTTWTFKTGDTIQIPALSGLGFLLFPGLLAAAGSLGLRCARKGSRGSRRFRD